MDLSHLKLRGLLASFYLSLCLLSIAPPFPLFLSLSRLYLLHTPRTFSVTSLLVIPLNHHVLLYGDTLHWAQGLPCLVDFFLSPPPHTFHIATTVYPRLLPKALFLNWWAATFDPHNFHAPLKKHRQKKKQHSRTAAGRRGAGGAGSLPSRFARARSGWAGPRRSRWGPTDWTNNHNYGQETHGKKLTRGATY